MLSPSIAGGPDGAGSAPGLLHAPDDAGAVPRPPLAIAHRGASAELRENTLPAVARALELGSDGIELDVHATRDGAVVVHHDADVVREPHAPERRARIATLTLAELREVDLGGGERIPTLDEVMELVAGRAEILVELKASDIERRVVSCLLRHRAPYAVHSFFHAPIARIAASTPQVRRGILFDKPPANLGGALARTAAHDVWLWHPIATPELILQAHAGGARVIAWTVNDPLVGAALTAAGVDGLCTDDVRWLQQPPAPVASQPVALPSTLGALPLHA